MAARNDRVLKIILLVDGAEVPNLVKVNDQKVEKGMVEVPAYDRIVQIQNGIRKIPALELEYKDSVGGNAVDVYNAWFENNEVHDVTVKFVDAVGVEFDRHALPACECQSYARPGYDAANPEYAKILVTLLPYDNKRIKA